MACGCGFFFFFSVGSSPRSCVYTYKCVIIYIYILYIYICVFELICVCICMYTYTPDAAAPAAEQAAPPVEAAQGAGSRTIFQGPVFAEMCCHTHIFSSFGCNVCGVLKKSVQRVGMLSDSGVVQYRAAQMHGIPNCKSFSAKEPLIIRLFCVKMTYRDKTFYASSPTGLM